MSSERATATAPRDRSGSHVDSWVRGLLIALSLLVFSSGTAAARDLLVVTIDGSINQASAEYLIDAIERAEAEGAAAVLIELDTPGGFVLDTQDIIQAMLNASVPTIVYVTPRGASATSAGTFITIAANVAAMTPGTSIGAAHPLIPVGSGSKPPAAPGEETEEAPQTVIEEKLENYLAAYIESIAKQRKRNVEWAEEAVRNSVAVTADEALELNVIDLIAKSRAELIEAIEGRVVEVNGEEQTLSLADARAVPVEMTLVQRIFDFLIDPNLAFILFAIGAGGLYLEFQNPGMIVPGAVGVIAMLILGFTMHILPFSWVGALLVLVGVALLIAELFITSFGLLFAAGLTCFLLGGTMVFDRPDVWDLTVSFWDVLVPIALAMTLTGAFIAYTLGRSFMNRQTAGIEQMVGLIARCESDLDPKGKVFVRGEYWNAQLQGPERERALGADDSDADGIEVESSGERARAGEAVEVVAVDGLTLHVRRRASRAQESG
jgi:membrane-bound serine protease (ClpP class)